MRELVERVSKALGEKYYFALHESGLPIFIFPKKMTTVYAEFAVKFGSLDNTLDDGGTVRLPDGVAHFLEHKMFSNEDGSDSFERFSAFGADANAYTAYSRTVYLFSCTDQFEKSFGELIDFVTSPYFTSQTVEKEKGIIAEEIRMCRDDPYDRCYRNMLLGLYKNHPVKIDICGSEQSISRITEKTLYEAYRAYYTPPNMALVVCGDVTPEEVLQIAEKHLPKRAPEGAVPPRRTVAEPPHAVQSTVIGRGRVAKPIFAIGIKDVAVPEDADARIRRDVALNILTQMIFADTGELYNRLLDGGFISPAFSASYTLCRDVGFMRASGEAADPARVLAEIKAYLGELREKGLSREDFERCRRVEFAEYIKSFDSTEEIADNLVAFYFDGAELFGYADVIRGVTFEEVAEIFANFFLDECFVLSVLLPEGESDGEERREK